MAKRDDFDLTTKGRDALIEAARNKNQAQARRLLAGGIHPDCGVPKGRPGDVPLMFAAANNFVEGIKMLLDAGADPHVVDSMDFDSLAYACHCGCSESADALLSRVEYKMPSLQRACLAATLRGHGALADKIVARIEAIVEKGQLEALVGVACKPAKTIAL